MRITPRALAPLAGSIVLLSHSQAQIIWSDVPTSTDWNVGANWVGGDAPDTITEQAIFGTSAITGLNISLPTTLNKITFNAGSPEYSFTGAALTLDVNFNGAASADAILTGANSAPVTFFNAVVFRDNNANNTPSNVNTGAGSIINFNGATSTQNNLNLQASGNGTMNINAGSTLTLGGQLQQTGNATLNVFIDPATGQIRSFSNGGGGVRLHANLNEALGLGVTGATSHAGRIFIAANGVTATGALSTGGGSIAGSHTMDVTFGTDIPDTGSATHTNTFTLANLGSGTGTTANVRIDVGTDDTLFMTGAINGTLGGYSAPQLIKQGTGTLVATGANGYSVPTLVAAGTMIVTPAQAGGSAITINDGATFGVRLVGAGPTFNTSSLTLGNGTSGTLFFDLQGQANPLVPVVNTSTFTPGVGALLRILGSGLTVGTFPAIDYITIGGAGFAGLSLSLPPRIVGRLNDNVANSSVDVEIQGIDFPTWRGNVSNAWDIDDGSGTVGTPNWFATFSNVVARYVQSPTLVDSVIFNDTAVNPLVELPSDVSPTGVSINNSTLTYTFSGFGKITGASVLGKQGTGTVIFANAVPYDYTGSTAVNGGTLQIGDGTTFGVGFLPLGGVVNNATVTISRAEDAVLAGNISGTGVVNKLGTNNLTLTGALTYSGITTIANGTLTLSPTAAYTLPSQITGAGSLVKMGTPTVVLGGNASYAGTTTISGGILQFGDAALGAAVGTRGLSGAPTPNPIVVNAGSVGFGRADTTLIIPNTISGAGGLFIAGSFGSIVTLTGTNTFTGGVNISGGGLRILNVSALGNGTKTITITNGTAGQPSLRLDGSAGGIVLPSTFSFNSSSTDPVNSAIVNEAGDNVINGNFTMTQGGGATRIRVAGGSLTLNGNVTTNSTARVLILDGTNDGLFTGVLNNTNAPGLQKDGTGTWRMTGAHLYTGATNINAGTLITTTAQLGATPVTVASGAVFGIETLIPGAIFNVPSLTLNGGTVQVDPGFGAIQGLPLVNATTFSATAGSTIRVLGGSLDTGTFTAIDYTGAIGGSGFAGLTLALPNRVTGQLIDNALNTSVDVEITAVNFPVWTGSVSGVWDLDNGAGTGTQNWKEQTSGTVTRYRQNAPDTDSVSFDDTATGSTTINLSTTLTPVTVNVLSSSLNYTFAGAGKLSGAASLLKDGTSKLTLLNTTPNDNTGTTTIIAGTLEIGDGVTPAVGTLGTGRIALNGGTLALNRPDDLTLPNAVSGTGTLIKMTPNLLSFTSAFNLGGTLQLNGGITRFLSGGNIGAAISGSGGMRVEGGTLQLSGTDANTYTGLTTVAAGTLQLNKSGANAVGGNILFTGTGALTLTQGNQIADTAIITYDKAINGGTIIIGNETFAELNIVNGNDTGAQVQAQTGFVVTGLAKIAGTGLFAIASNHTATIGGLTLSSAGAILRIAANSNPSTLLVGSSGITASGGTIQVGQGAGAFNAVLSLGGDFTATGDVSITDGNFGGVEQRQITVDAVRTFQIATDTTTSVAPDFAGPGGITKTGGGTLTLLPSSTSTYTGLTSVNGGTLLVNGSLNGTALVAVNGGTLGGNGSINAPVDVTIGTVAPGTGPGILTVSNATFSGGTFAAEIFGPFAGGGYDQLVTNSLSLSANAALTLDLGAYDPLDDGSNIFVLVDNIGAGPVTGPGKFVFAGNVLDEGESFIAGSQAFQITYAGGGGNDVALIAVPEPGTVALLPVAAGALLGLRRRHRGRS
jgi:autotransporter-associated beta strand protein